MADRETLDIHRNAKDLINQFSVVLRTAQLHDPGNVAVLSAIKKFVAMISELIRQEGSIVFELRGEFFYINDSRIRYSLEYLLNFDFLVREFKRRQLGGIIIRDQITIDDIKGFTTAFLAAASAEDPFSVMEEKLSGAKYLGIERLRQIVEEDSHDVRKMVKKTYFNAVSYARGVINKIKSGEKINIKKAKRVVETMVDQILEQEHLLLGMTAIKDYDEYTYHHSVNVSILSIALGQRMGLSRKMLTDLGMVALFHDIGKMNIPHEILNKPTNFSDDEWKIIKDHPFWGIKALLKLKKLDELTMKSAIVAFEHHMHFDHSGYPKVKMPMELDLYSRIVSLADQYDAMTSARVYSRVPLPPDKALSIMLERTGTQLDPMLFKIFTNMVGVFPIGTLVMLDSKELGLVYESNQLYPARPRVLVIVDGKGNRVKGYHVDVTEKNEQDEYVRSIVRTMDPNKYRINLAEYFL